MNTSKKWTVSPLTDPGRRLGEALGTSSIIGQMLLNRGVTNAGGGEAFLRPNLKLLHEPAGIPGLTAGARRVARAIAEGEPIVIYGDYDVDGITAVAILWHAIKLLGGDVRYYIPHRIEEGYGLNAEAIGQLCDAGAKLIVTVDCGITAVGPAKVAAERGVDLVITDHHEWKDAAATAEDGGAAGHPAAARAPTANGAEPTAAARRTAAGPTAAGPTAAGAEQFVAGAGGMAGAVLPVCAAIVHPRLPVGPMNQTDGVSTPAEYPNPHLCGAGVAFKLAWGIGQAVAGGERVPVALKGFLVEALALAALGTIADVVPLVGENRIIAHFGLGGLTRTKLTGLRALIESAKLDGTKLDSYHVGFLLAPRLNASGRMGHAALAVEMLTDADAGRAIEIATYLEEQNRQRQQTERAVLEEALAQVEALGLAGETARAIVVGGVGWHPGVVGIVASRLVDRFHRPTIVVALGETIGQGSGRSVDGFHLAHALECAADLLESFGGHEMAAGIKVRPENFEAFRTAFTRHCAGAVAAELLVPQIRVDCDADLRQVTAAFVQDLKRLGPFGRGNPKPLVRCTGVTLTGPPRRVGKSGDHLQLFLKQENATMKAIAFGAGSLFDQLKPGSTLSLAVEPQLNEWNGRVSVELGVKDLKIDA